MRGGLVLIGNHGIARVTAVTLELGVAEIDVHAEGSLLTSRTGLAHVGQIGGRPRGGGKDCRDRNSCDLTGSCTRNYSLT